MNGVSTYLFGSAARGDADILSDVDVLVVAKGGLAEGDIKENLPEEWGKGIALSWYGEDRLRRMYQDGDLFAWHLFNEAVPIHEGDFKLATLGRPNRYAQAIPDIQSFAQIAELAGNQAEDYPDNAAYECGILYVCIRNIAMSASWHLQGKPDFSRLSPYRLPEEMRPHIERTSYEVAMRCRMASQRGVALMGDVDALSVVKMAKEAVRWSVEVVDAVVRSL